MKKKLICLVVLIVAVFAVAGCSDSDSQQQKQQEVMLMEATNQVGMPAIINFFERKTAKMILEKRDQAIATYTYVWSDYQGKFIFVGESIGYPIPYSTQFTNPMKVDHNGRVIPQADPNGLFSPGNAEGTYILMKDPDSDKVVPVYFEPRMTVSPIKLRNAVY